MKTKEKKEKTEQNEKVKEMLIRKVEEGGGDEKFVDEVIKILEEERKGADKSKKNYFGTENLIIISSMLSSIVAGISGINMIAWGDDTSCCVKTWIDILFTVLPVILPAVVTMLVAYRGLKKSYETWIRHRKYSTEMEILINNYLYGSVEFDMLNDVEGFKKFRNGMQEIWKNSRDEFLSNMNK